MLAALAKEPVERLHLGAEVPPNAEVGLKVIEVRHVCIGEIGLKNGNWVRHANAEPTASCEHPERFVKVVSSSVRIWDVIEEMFRVNLGATIVWKRQREAQI